MKKVLIIDDEKNIRVSLTSALEDEGFKVFAADSGEEGLAKLKNINPDAIFLDIWLPGIDGLETLKKILAINPLQIVIVISGHGNIMTAVRAVKEGAYDFLEKPLSLEKVIFVLNRALEYQKLLEENKKLVSVLKEISSTDEEKKKVIREATGDIVFKVGDSQHLKKQKTIGKSSIFYGLGLHSGEKTGMVIKPLDPGKGIRFENISESGFIPARVEYVDQVSYATSIKKDTLVARTIEHLMATLHAAGVTNLAIKINKEVPIVDGSAQEFCRFIKESEVIEQEDFIPEIVINESLVVGSEINGDKYIKIEPADDFEIEYKGIYPEPLGPMEYTFKMDSFDRFIDEIAPARTFGFVQEFSKLSQMGLAEGGRINNFILIDNGRVVNTELRFKDELVRHKILDIIGDFYLLGRPIKGRITAFKTGHFENIQMVNLIKEKYL